MLRLVVVAELRPELDPHACCRVLMSFTSGQSALGRPVLGCALHDRPELGDLGNDVAVFRIIGQSLLIVPLIDWQAYQLRC